MIFKQPTRQGAPRWLMLAHERSQRVGRVRMMVETSIFASVAAVVLASALAPWMGVKAGTWLVATVFVLVAGAVAIFLGTTLPVLQELSVARLRARKVATHDANTGIVNRRHFTQLAFREWERCRRYRSGAAMLMIETDHFAAVQEEFGKEAGNAVIRSIALACDGMLRRPDLLGHQTDEALVVFLPHTDMLGAVDVAERLRAVVAQTRVAWTKHPIRITVSVGVATLGDQHLSLNSLILDAESALHAAQSAGRNCVRTSAAPPSARGRSYPVMPVGR